MSLQYNRFPACGIHCTAGSSCEQNSPACHSLLRRREPQLREQLALRRVTKGSLCCCCRSSHRVHASLLQEAGKHNLTRRECARSGQRSPCGRALLGMGVSRKGGSKPGSPLPADVSVPAERPLSGRVRFRTVHVCPLRSACQLTRSLSVAELAKDIRRALQLDRLDRGRSQALL